MVLAKDLRIVAAKKILYEAAAATESDSILIAVDEAYLEYAECLVSASKLMNMKDVEVLYLPKVQRPLKGVPKFLEESIRRANVFIYIIDRMPEDSHLVYGRIWDIAKEAQCRYLTMHDPQPGYFNTGGILADYGVVEEKGKLLVTKLENVISAEVKSEMGTNVTFSFDPKSKPTYRSCSYKYKNNLETGVIQIPEGEGGKKPLSETLNGTIVIDGAITGLGIPPKPVSITYKNGKVKEIDGDKIFLEVMFDYARRQGYHATSLRDMNNFGEFSIGFNDWARFDWNTSNCEKVTGGIHFSLGSSEGEWYDNILTKPTVNLQTKDGRNECLIDAGTLRL